MRILLDTHIFLWFVSGDRRLSNKHRNILRDESNEVYLSAVSVWEATVRFQIGKLPLPDSPDRYLVSMREVHRIASLPMDEGSVALLTWLPPLHSDPFDRMLVCQAMRHGLVIATVDPLVIAYPISSL